MKQRMLPALLSLALLGGCVDPNLQPQPGGSSAGTAGEAQQPVIPQHNLSQVAEAIQVNPEQLAAIEVGKTTKAELTALLGETKPFTLGDGKQIFRYDVGKFIFGADGVLLRKHLNP